MVDRRELARIGENSRELVRNRENTQFIVKYILNIGMNQCELVRICDNFRELMKAKGHKLLWERQ